MVDVGKRNKQSCSLAHVQAEKNEGEEEKPARKQGKAHVHERERERERETNGEVPNQGSESQKETQASRRCLFLIQKKDEEQNGRMM